VNTEAVVSYSGQW